MRNLDTALYKWIRQANEKRDDLGLPAGFIEESVALLKQKLGEEYLEQRLIIDSEPIPVMDDEAHPLRKWLLSAHVFRHIVSVMELASYFLTFVDDAALVSKIEKLKRDSFWSTFFELAMATRAKRACRGEERVFLNAETAESVGDFTISVPGALIPVECSRLGRSLVPSMASPSALLEALSNRISDGAEKARIPICVKIRSDAPLNGDTYNRALRLTRRGLSDVRALRLPAKHDDGTVMIELEKLTRESEQIPFRETPEGILDVAGTEWTFAARLSWVPAKDRDEITERHKRGEKFHQYEGLRLFTRFAQQKEEPDPYSRLEAKLRKKLKQTKIKEGHFGKIVIVEVPFDLRTVNEDRLASAIRSAATRSRNALSIFLANRESTPQMRECYSYSAQYNATAAVIRPDVIQLLNRFMAEELSTDPILALPYRRTWEEAQAYVRYLAESRDTS